MENKINSVLVKLKNAGGNFKAFIALGLVGILLIALSEALPSKNSEKSVKTEDALYSAYTAELEEKTSLLLSSISGVGESRVMITLKYTEENVFAKNTEENGSEGSFSKNDEYVLYNGQSGEEPLVIKQCLPEIQGVAVVCQGADNSFVREEVITAVASLFNIPVSKISVSKLKG